MKEYIDKQKLLQEYWKTNLYMLSNHFEKIIQDMPAEDVTQVVRCGECKYSTLPSAITQRYWKPGALTCHHGPCNFRNVLENDFCSYGEKMDLEG